MKRQFEQRILQDNRSLKAATGGTESGVTTICENFNYLAATSWGHNCPITPQNGVITALKRMKRIECFPDERGDE